MIPSDQLVRVVPDQIQPLPETLRFPGLQSADEGIAVEADVDSLEQFVGLVAGCGQDPFAVP